MENLKMLEGLLQKLSDNQMKYAVANLQLASDEKNSELQLRLNRAVDRANEAWSEIVTMFEREHERVERLSEWLATTTWTLAEMTASISGKLKE